MNPSLAHLSPLVGTWRGSGHGEYPTITSFDYTDEWQFIDIGKPFLLFVERTWNAAGNPMHTETGYVRAPSHDTLEIVAAIPTGQSELGVGTCSASGESLTLTTDAEIRCTPTAKRVDRIVRRFEQRGEELDYTMEMSAVGQGLTLHLSAHLTRQG
ncbi:MAG TPA: FABP family protein [Propionibacteriaceae bacterium]|nr:FABP family protein [Propionibacteriaceae bacterium]